jgi:hypothetical protein
MISRGVADSVPAQLRQVAVLLPAMPGHYRIPAGPGDRAGWPGDRAGWPGS